MSLYQMTQKHRHERTTNETPNAESAPGAGALTWLGHPVSKDAEGLSYCSNLSENAQAKTPGPSVSVTVVN